MKDTTPQAVYLKDYLAPDYLIDTVDLSFELDETATRVRSRLAVRRNPDNGAHDRPLVLDGQELKLERVMMDGEVLGANRYQVDENHLTISDVPDSFALEVETVVNPKANTALEGLYVSNDTFCTQCEAEGFRKITYFPDRPDVMARYRTTIVGDGERYPVMLSNGNLVEEKTLGDGRRAVTWEDPFPKPSYLFALVAGDLALHRDRFTTMSGREVDLRLYVEPRNIDKCEHAMASLKKAMAWDERAYGREYDLDIYMIVAVDDFNMGAMENKGLNVFNSKYVLARPESATDADYAGIEAVIAHEYFHNWTGNRITCRDWFQLSLKEGLTVFREQQFVADVQSEAVSRIHDVRILRNAQFPEDSGPTAHPVRPDSYIEINNFYTPTVYNKGAEVIRMLHRLLGADGFRRGMDLYFERHDGQAVTCEDFVAAMADANGRDLSGFKLWYEQAGTPWLRVETAYDAQAQRYRLTVRQEVPATPGQADKKPMVIPLAVGLVDGQGRDMPLRLVGEDEQTAASTTRVLEIDKAEQSFEFEGVAEKPVPSLLRGFSAPVKLDAELSDGELAFLMAHDSDSFNRWEAAQFYGLRVLRKLIDDDRAGRAMELPRPFVDAFAQTLGDGALDKALVAEALTLPSETYVAETFDVIDVHAIHRARQFARGSLAQSLRDALEAAYRANIGEGAYVFTPEAVGARSLRNLCLAYLGTLGESEITDIVHAQFERADNMTDEIGALAVLTESDEELRKPALARFYEKWRDDPLVVDKWFTVQAMARRDDVLDDVKALLDHPAFSIRNPNKVRALIGAFAAGNPAGFHRDDGAGYDFLVEQILRLDALNPQVAARLLGPFRRWRRYADPQGSLMRAALERIVGHPGLSRDAFEIATKSLA